MTPRTAASTQESTVSRRTVLRGAVGAVAFGVLGNLATSSAAAMNKAELIEAIASESGLSKADAKRALDAFVSATTTALKNGDRVGLADFGSFEQPRPGSGDVEFTATHQLAAALDLLPGAGDGKRVEARGWPIRKKPGRTRRADWGGPAPTVVVDADLLLAELAADRGDSKLSKADAKRALDAFVTATTTALQRGDEVSIDEFGSFSISKRSARTGRNPQTGKQIEIPAKTVVKFEAGADLLT